MTACAQVPAAVAGKLSAESRYWWSRAVGTSARNQAKAIIVSRRQFENLRAVRSWQDLAALRDYVEWSDRAEAAGFNGSEILADVSTNDLILLRVPAASVSASVKLLRDPIGYAVLDPAAGGTFACPAPRVPAPAAGGRAPSAPLQKAQRGGPVAPPMDAPAAPRTDASAAPLRRICVKLSPSKTAVPDLAAGLPIAPVPVLNAVVKAGDVVTVYGAALAGRTVRIFSRKGEGQVLYAGPNQINAKLPSIDEVCVEVDGLKSDWAEVQR